LRDIAIQHGGLVIVDDSLSYGVLGRRHGDEAFGDGTGTIRWLSHGHNGILWLASLAKAYGTPIAVLTGPRVVVESLQSTGNRLHASAPSAPDLHAAWRALTLREEVRQRRRRLHALVMLLRTGLINAGLAVRGLPFPVVPIPMPTPMALRWWGLLRSNGIDALVQLPRCLPGAQVSFALSPRHSPVEVGRVVGSLRGIKESSSAA
jgi:8-amino-7-oxononanoate synthase